MESERDETLKSTEEKTSSVQKALEAALKKLKEQSACEKEALRCAHDEDMRKMSSFYNAEKEKNEQRTAEEREKNEVKFQRLKQDYEEKLRNELQSHDEDMEALKAELANVKISNSSYVQNLTTENTKRAEQNEQLSSQLKQVTEEYEALKKGFTAKIDQARDAYEAEQAELLQSSDQLKQLLAEKEAKLWEQGQALQSSRSELQKLSELSAVFQASSEKDLTRVKAELLDAKTRAESSGNALVEQKIEFGKQIALANQQNSFLTHRVEELLKQ